METDPVSYLEIIALRKPSIIIDWVEAELDVKDVIDQPKDIIPDRDFTYPFIIIFCFHPDFADRSPPVDAM